MEAKHTPGPWESGDSPYIVDRTGEGDAFSGGDWIVVPPLGESGPIAIVNSAANAHLIAAAPDLLKAAKRALSVLKATGESVRPGNALGALQDAIAKAEAQS